MKVSFRWTILLAALAVSFPPPVLAAGPGQGETSGPAAGSTTAPSTAVQKQASNPNGSTAAGAPGVAGKSGAESGDKDKHTTSKEK